jgi:hypothetical protein
MSEALLRLNSCLTPAHDFSKLQPVGSTVPHVR